MKCSPAIVMSDPPPEAPNEVFTPVRVWGCTTAKSTANPPSSSNEQESVALSTTRSILVCVCAGIVHNRAVDVRNVDNEAWTMKWVDRLRTCADKRMWSGRRAVVMRTGRRVEILGVKLGCPRRRCRAVVSDVLCVRSNVHFVCVCVYMCMCVCVRT